MRDKRWDFLRLGEGEWNAVRLLVRGIDTIGPFRFYCFPGIPPTDIPVATASQLIFIIDPFF